MKLITKEEFLDLKINLEKLPFCFQKDYLKSNTDIFFLQQDKIIAPVCINKSKLLKILQFQFAPLFLSGEYLKQKDEKLFLENAVKFISENKLVDRIAQPKNYALFNALPENVISCAFGTYKIDLSNKSDSQLLEAMQSRYRTAIRQIEKLNVEIKLGASELKAFQKLHNETMKRTDAYSEDYSSLKEQVEALPHNTLLATVYINNKLQGGLYIMYSNFCAYYFHGASANTTEASGAIKYLHYKMMCLMRDKGVKHYDFVGARLSDVSGTKLEGIQNFKKRFGAELIEGYLWKKDINKTKCKTYDSLLKVKCKLKGTKYPVDIIDQERRKQRNN